MAKNRYEMLPVHGGTLSAHSTIPGVSKLLAWGVRHVLKRLPKPVTMLHALIPLHPSLKTTTKMRNNVKNHEKLSRSRS